MNDPNFERQFVQLINEHQGIIHKICSLYCKDKEHRKDLFQEILIQLWQSYPSFRGTAKFSSWMYRVGLNVAIQDFRKVKKRHQIFFYTNEFEEEPEGLETGQTEEKLSAMHRAIAGLNRVDESLISESLTKQSQSEIALIKRSMYIKFAIGLLAALTAITLSVISWYPSSTSGLVRFKKFAA